jgi:hypothetical protein
MSFKSQINARRKLLNRTIPEIAEYVAIQSPNLYRMLASDRDMRGSTLDALAAALDAQWMLIPKHLVPEVERLLSGKTIGPDDVPSSVERLLGDKQ